MWQNRLFYLLGCWILGVGCLEVVPLLAALYNGESQAAGAFGASMVLTLLIGGGLFLGFRSAIRIQVKIASIILPLTAGIAMGFMVSVPFWFIHFDRGVIPALYEGISMLTTNGASAYAADEVSTYSEVLWRAMIAWSGGLLAVAMTLSILTNLNSGGLQAYASKLQFGDSGGVGSARLRAIVKALFPVYSVLTLACVGLLMFTDLSAFNSLVVAMGTISTSGINYNLEHQIPGFGAQLVVVLFMVIASMQWDVFYAYYRGMKHVRLLTTESRQMLIILLIGSVLIFVIPSPDSDIGYWEGFFLAVSALSTTGYISADLDLNNIFLPVSILLIMLAACGGTVAGTGGGIKQFRLRVLSMLSRNELKRLAHPHGVFPMKISGVRLNKRDIDAVWLLFGSFLVAISVSSLIFAILGIHFQDAVVLSFTALTLSGPLATVIDPSFGGFTGLNDADYLILSMVMLFGRVEMSIFMALLARTFWRR